MRIVSLLASATEIVCALGAGDMLVGRSHECDNPAWVSHLPACSSPAFDTSVSSREIDAEVRRRIHSGLPLYLIDSPLIQSLQPDLVITQSHCEVCAVTPGDVERSGVCMVNARQLALSAGSLEGIFADIGRVAEQLGLAARSCELVAAERRRLAAVQQQTASLRRPTVVMIEWTDPIFAMANWGWETGRNRQRRMALLGRPGEYSTALPAGDLHAADPEFLIVAPCGFNLARGLRDQPVLEQHPWWRELQAVRSGKVAFAGWQPLL